MAEIKYTVLEGNRLKIENLQNRNIIYRNFSGNKTPYNKNGDLKFTIAIDDVETAQKLASYGWNVKIKPSKNDANEMFCTLEVRVRFDLSFAKPNVVQFTRKSRVQINQDNIRNFDDAEFDKVDLVLRQYLWRSPSGETGASAQLSEMYVKIHEGELEAKWAEEEYPGEDALPFDMD